MTTRTKTDDEIPARFKDQEKSHRLHRGEQSQYPDEESKADLEEEGQQGGERNPHSIAGDEGGGQ